MGYQVFYDPIISFSSVPAFRGFLVSSFAISAPMLVRGVRISIVMVNNPTITGLQAVLNNKLSVMRDISSFAPLKNGLYDVFFEFDFERWLIPAPATNIIRIFPTGYAYSEASHIGVVRDWPDQVYANIAASDRLQASPRLFTIAGQRVSVV